MVIGAYAEPVAKGIALTQENPSFALHGIRLAELIGVQVESNCPNCSLVVDVTLREVKDDAFYINQMPVDMSKCVPTLNDTQSMLSTCQWTYQTRVLLQPGNVTELGISVRVKEWTDDSAPTFVMPVAPRGANFQGATFTVGDVLGTTGTVITVLSRNTTFPTALLYGFNVSPKFCAPTIVAGAAPSKNGNDKNLLLRLQPNDLVGFNRFQSSAFSIVLPPKCQASMQLYDWPPEMETNGIFDEGKYVITSRDYPWVFDDSTTQNDAFVESYLNTNLPAVQFPIDFEIQDKLGGTLYIGIQQFDQAGNPIGFANYTSLVDTPFEKRDGFFGQSMRVRWEPVQAAQRKGFILRVTARAPIPSPTAPTTVLPTGSSENPTSTATIASTTTKSSTHFTIYLPFAFVALLLSKLWC
ncbi:unnamed protein product, partial [Mesorhabditis spiculigera]